MTDLLDRPLRDTWRIWAALILPPLMWGGRLVATWTVAEISCANGWATTPTYYSVQTAMTASALAITIASGWAGWSARRSSETDDLFDPAGTENFLAVTGAVSAVVFSLLILLEGSGVYLLGCG